ncbi:hypothetical protein C7H19_20215 [Aphanothece hegewaldii CCALA 016]|uniref:Type IV secretion system protein VirB4 n=1 Tax=Aphanothece hegewaldii CCALA 016 TaxID=2107694 RepID=A0A2T1LSZ3_9CHRO|nr:hypothetical protein [Aphanothece hegewaldii]PSF33325.1 hypothetical protein C7H19_20215 [Aphanothece hegewaldii CCALA 016]
MPKKLKKVRVDVYDPIQNYLDLASYCRFSFDQDIGVYLLKASPDDPPTFVFGWELEGIHSYTPLDQLQQRIERAETGLKDFPLGDSLMLRSLILPDDSDRQSYLDKLIVSSPCDELKFFLYGEKSRVRELTLDGYRVVKKDFLFVTYSAESEKEAADWIERALFWVQGHILSYFGEANTFGQEQYERAFRGAKEAQTQWHSFITDKLELKARILTADEMRSYAWSLFNDTPDSEEFPQLITYDRQGLKLQMWSETSPATLLFQHHVPMPDRRWIYNPATKTYCTVLTFLDKPYGWNDAKEQAGYLFRLLEKRRIKHIEFISQIWRGDQRVARISMEKLIRESVNRDKSARKKQNIDVGANLQTEESVQAQVSLIQGNVPFHVGMAMIVHAETPEEADQIALEIRNSFQSPAVVIQEKEVAWEIWMQAMPLTKAKLLQATLTNRTLDYLNTEVLGLFPLLTTVTSSHKGVELVAQDSKIPVYLNVFEYEGRHVGFFASSRSGKSVFIGSVLTLSLSQDIPVIAIDYPGSSGRSTFTDYTQYLSVIGDYFDVREYSFNIFDRIDLSRIYEPKERSKRWSLYLGFLKDTLTSMVLGGSQAAVEGRLETEVKTVISFVVNAFFKDPDILAAYEKAEAGKLGSPEWKLYSPTLKHFIARCSREVIASELPEDFAMNSEALENTLYFVKLRLSYWLHSEIGSAIGSPSTVKPDAKLIVFALTALKEDESEIFALIAFTAAYSRSLEYPRSLFFIDESPILIKFPAIAKIVAALFANGSKSGIRVVLSAQAPDQLAQSAATRGDILQNMHYRFLGRVEETAIESCCRILGVSETMVKRCAEFEPDRVQGKTQWLFYDGSRYTFVNYYAPPVQLATLANNTDEAKVRTALTEHYPDNSFLALYQFSQMYRKAAQTRKGILEVYEQEKPITSPQQSMSIAS